MKIAGIIAEYNPFHTGHAYHIEETRRLSGCDYVAICMSGCFTQRGEPACLPVHERAKAALMNGADAVFLLPALWAVRPADAFARGGVGILGGIGCDVLSFGSEIADPALIEQLAALRENEPETVTEHIRQALERGESHARARGEAIAEYLGIDSTVLNAPNLSLAVEYTCAIRAQRIAMETLPVPRIGGYHDETPDRFASASAVRKALADGDDAILRYLPECEKTIVKTGVPHSMDDILLYRLRSMSEQEAAALPDITEGLDRRILRAAAQCSGRDELIAAVKCKRYTYARISRSCTHAVLGLTESMVRENPVPARAQLIGVRRESMNLLKELNARSRIEIVSDAVKLKDDPVFKFESHVYDIYSLLSGYNRKARQMFTEKFLII